MMCVSFSGHSLQCCRILLWYALGILGYLWNKKVWFLLYDSSSLIDMQFFLQGPQYVCTTFWTFVCITCSGIQWVLFRFIYELLLCDPSLISFILYEIFACCILHSSLFRIPSNQLLHVSCNICAFETCTIQHFSKKRYQWNMHTDTQLLSWLQFKSLHRMSLYFYSPTPI